MGYKQPGNERVVGGKVVRGQEVGWVMYSQHPKDIQDCNKNDPRDSCLMHP